MLHPSEAAIEQEIEGTLGATALKVVSPLETTDESWPQQIGAHYGVVEKYSYQNPLPLRQTCCHALLSDVMMRRVTRNQVTDAPSVDGATVENALEEQSDGCSHSAPPAVEEFAIRAQLDIMAQQITQLTLSLPIPERPDV
ncbi:hypothetical protein NE237_021120 [Protea cynaroides]|uniref:Uncharacterized protein n=1 Tax=Protea cynaroides TaxID=273540 RepID=A0A9Q0HAQ4_9MAGN|nr:hypothetical protein NE237_021120 [Protea cynaroides]